MPKKNNNQSGERSTITDIKLFHELAKSWIEGITEVRNSDDPVVITLAKASGQVLYQGQSYVLVAHGSRGGWNQSVIDDIGLLAPQPEYTTVVAGTVPFRQQLDEILSTTPSDRGKTVWNVWLAPAPDPNSDDLLDYTSPWFPVSETLGWSEDQLKEYLIEKLGPDHKYKGVETHLYILPSKYRIGRF